MSTPDRAFREALGDPSLWIDDPAEMARYTVDWTRKYSGPTPLVVRPRSTEDVAKILSLCNDRDIALIPQGGNTGMVGGGVPRNGELILSLERMRAIEEFDPISATVQVQAGVVLEALQVFLADHDHEMTVDLGARGSCQIGGMIATNAGGVKVLRYGHMREQLRGLEVVLADGTVVSSMNRLRKNNTGIDLKQMFVGSEGTLGVITRAVLQAQPQPPARRTAFAATAERTALPSLLARARALFRGLSSLEFLTGDTIDFVREVDPDFTMPITGRHPGYLLIEEETDAGEAASAAFLERLEALLVDGLITDAVVAASEAQVRAFWRVREAPTETISRVGLTHKFDVTVPPQAIPAFLDGMEAIGREVGGVRPLQFGHLGDGNVHVNMAQQPGVSDEAFQAKATPLADRIYRTVRDLDGSISAEHGIGVMKRAYLPFSRTAAEIALMRRVKAALDPKCILNPGVIVES